MSDILMPHPSTVHPGPADELGPDVSDMDTCSITTWESRHDAEASANVEADSTTTVSVGVDDDDIDTLHGDIVAEIDDYVKTHPLEYASPTFHADLVAEVTETIFEATIHSDLCDETDQNHQEIADMVQSIAQFYFQHAGIYPVRSFPPEAPLSEMPRRGADADLERHFQQLKSLPQPAQRTPEWYAFRHNLLTASNIYMALGTTAQRNRLICEKCKPLVVPTTQSAPNTQSATHWGQKYEQVTTMIYESMFPGNHVDTEFGCIQHPEHAFLGASPDGIVTSGPRVGHMVEIKNTVSRVIADTPIMSHWVQCQVQMETCNLDYCDYIQTSIAEIDEATFYEEKDQGVGTVGSYKGLILHLISHTEGGADYKYLYTPLNLPMTRASVTKWIQTHSAVYRSNYILFQAIYWRLREVSCVVIPRNRDWFQAALPMFKSAWETIEHEREHGYDHRLPKKRAVAERTMNVALYNTIIKLDT